MQTVAATIIHYRTLNRPPLDSKIPTKPAFYGQEDHRHLFSIKLKPFSTFAIVFILVALNVMLSLTEKRLTAVLLFSKRR